MELFISDFGKEYSFYCLVVKKRRRSEKKIFNTRIRGCKIVGLKNMSDKFQIFFRSGPQIIRWKVWRNISKEEDKVKVSEF